MLAELWIYLASALVVFCLLAGWRSALFPLAKRAFLIHTILLCLAFAALLWAHFNNQFTVDAVASNSYIDLPIYYKLSASWASQQGSLLLWLCLQALIAQTLIHAVARFDGRFQQHILLTLAMLQLGLLLFALIGKSPFASAPLYEGVPYSIFGHDLNPMLQDPLMAIHPPLLYIGYISFSASFALIIAALLAANTLQALKNSQALLRRYNLLAVAFLTIGIGFGSLWAYRELGFGGFWFWDAVENASLIPWLLAVALLHALGSPSKKLLTWQAILSAGGYLSCLFGTFVVRSGLLLSVHNFANDPRQALLLLLWLTVVIVATALLLALKLPQLAHAGALKFKVWLLLGNTVLFAGATFTVVLGTLAPLLYQFFGKEITVGSAYFNSFMPYFAALLLFGLLAQFLESLHNKTRAVVIFIPLLAALSAGFYFLLDVWWQSANAISAFLLALLLLAALAQVGLWAQKRRKLPMLLAHLAIIVISLSITISSDYSRSYSVLLGAHQSASVGGMELKLVDIQNQPRTRYPVQSQWLKIAINGQKPITAILNHHILSDSTMREIALDSNWARDIYLVAGQEHDHKWLLHIQYKPLQRWLWLGAALLFAAFLLAILKGKAK